MWSRSLSSTSQRISYDTKVPHLVEQLSEWNLPQGTILDGELISSSDTVYDVNKVTNSSSTNAILHQQRNGALNYVVFDIIYFGGRPVYNWPLHKRLQLLEQLFAIYRAPNIELAQSWPMTHSVEQYRAVALKLGWEGYIVKNLDSLYLYKGSFGYAQRPSNTWWKIKPVNTADVVVTGFEYGKGETNADAVGSLRCCQYVNGELTEVCKVGSGLSAADRRQLLNYDFSVTPRVAVIQYSHRHKNGKLIHPKWCGFREDKRPDECISE